MSQRAVSVVIPCFNEEQAIAETIENVAAALGERDDFEILVIDDGSTDRSREILEDFEGRLGALRVISHERNAGYGAALKTGIRNARHELIAITDADGTYPNDRLGELVDLAADADMVVGARTGPNVSIPLMRRTPKRLLKSFAEWITGREIPDLNSGMRVFRRSVIARYTRILPNTFSFTTTITIAMLRDGEDVRFVPIDYATRVGSSKIKPIRDTLRFFQLVLRTGMYFAPLRVLAPVIAVLFLGFFCSLSYDLFVLGNVTDKTLLLLFAGTNAAMLALLADMIDKRSGR